MSAIEPTEESAPELCPLRVGNLLKAGQVTFPSGLSQAYNNKAKQETQFFGIGKGEVDTDSCTNCRIRWIPGWSVSVKIDYIKTKRGKAVRRLVYKCDNCSYRLLHQLPAPGTPKAPRNVTSKKPQGKITKPTVTNGKPGKLAIPPAPNSLKAMLELKKQKEQKKASLNLMDFMN